MSNWGDEVDSGPGGASTSAGAAGTSGGGSTKVKIYSFWKNE